MQKGLASRRMAGKISTVKGMRRNTLIMLALAGLAGCQSRSLPPGPVLLNNVQEARWVIEQSTLGIVPLEPASLNLFERYSPKEDALWASGWQAKIDMTGVATDEVRTCTLISPCHVIMASHYLRNVGQTVTFHDRNGRAIVRVIEDVVSLPGGLKPDIALARLDQDTPVKFYKVLPPRDDYHEHLLGALAVVTDHQRNLLMRRIARVGDRRVGFAKAIEFSEACADPLVVGDSGNPGFVIINGEPVLIETHTFGGMGMGPFISDPENYAEINEYLRDLGGGYRLTPIRIGPSSDG